MIKSFLIIISFSILLFSSQQIVLVVADDFSTSKAKLEFFEDKEILYSASVNIGKNGLGWGIGEHSFHIQKDEPLKYEGDLKAPAGVFKLTTIFGYEVESHYKMPYLFTSKNLICIDDSNDNFYNQIVEGDGTEKSFERMKREDEQYKFGITVSHNQKGEFRRGSCIFMHIYKDINSSTAGCTAMSEEALKSIITTLDKSKNPLLIQIPKRSSQEVLKLYPQLKNSRLLH